MITRLRKPKVEAAIPALMSVAPRWPRRVRRASAAGAALSVRWAGSYQSASGATCSVTTINDWIKGSSGARLRASMA